MATKVDAEMIKQINNLYYQYHNYAQVSREVGVAPSTVKKYVIPGFEPMDETKFIKWEGDLPTVDYTKFREENWTTFLVLSDDEREEIKQLWKEIEI